MSIRNVVENVPDRLDVVVVMVLCVPKSMVTVWLALNPTPFTVTMVETEPFIGLTRMI